MLIKIAKNGIESEWFQLTKKRHRTLLLEKPDAVFVHIDSLYPKSPESGQIVELSFPCFNLLAREFVLEENRQEKQNERHLQSHGRYQPKGEWCANDIAGGNIS